MSLIKLFIPSKLQLPCLSIYPHLYFEKELFFFDHIILSLIFILLYMLEMFFPHDLLICCKSSLLCAAERKKERKKERKRKKRKEGRKKRKEGRKEGREGKEKTKEFLPPVNCPTFYLSAYTQSLPFPRSIQTALVYPLCAPIASWACLSHNSHHTMSLLFLLIYASLLLA